MNSFNKTGVTIVGLLVCGLLGFLSFTAFTYYSAYTLSGQYLRQANIALASNILLYGTIRAYHEEDRMLEVEVRNQYDDSDLPRTYRMLLAPDALVIKHTLLESDTSASPSPSQEFEQRPPIYTRVSPFTPVWGIHYKDTLLPGTRVKFLVTPKNDRIEVMSILVGNPL